MSALNGPYGAVLLIVMVIGSAVDILQFLIFLRRGYRKWKRTIINKAKQEVLWENYSRRDKSREEG